MVSYQITLAEANILPESALKTKPLFKKNKDDPSLYMNEMVEKKILTTAMREKLLANEIPALTFAVGHRGVDSVRINNVDIRATYSKGETKPWPRKPIENKEWRHSDFINVAYPYLYSLYDNFKSHIKPSTGGTK